MSDTFDHSDLPDDELLAAEYALGVLADVDRVAAERRIASERAFALLVAEWEQRLAPWAAEIPEVVPPPRVWERIATALPARRACGNALPLPFPRNRKIACGRTSRSGAG